MEQKGVAIKNVLRAIEARYGAEAVAAVQQALPGEVRAILDGGILPVGWYPVSVSAAIHAALRDLLGQGSWERSREIGRRASETEFGGVYKVLLRSVQYDTVWDRIEFAWKQYNSHGHFKWVERSPGRTEVHIGGVAGFNEGVWLSAIGRAERLVEIAGAKTAHGTLLHASPTLGKVEVVWLE